MSSVQGVPRGLAPGALLDGTFRGPPSKSLAQRALMVAGLALGETQLTGLGPRAAASADVAAAVGALEARGLLLDWRGDGSLRAVGRTPDAPIAADARIELGESGTLARLALAICALAAPPGTRSELIPSGSLHRRASPALLGALRAAGVQLEGEPWPRRVVACTPGPCVRLEAPSSSQEVSALLIALAAHPGTRRLEVLGAIPSRPYVDLTMGVLREFRAEVEVDGALDRETFSVRGPLRAPRAPLAIEADASSAAVALGAACLVDGGLRLPGLGAHSPQGDVRVLEHLAAFGCRTEALDEALVVAGAPRRGAQLDLSGEPDLAPVLAVVAAAAAQRGATSTLRGLGTLPGKESSRIEVLARGIALAGWSVDAGREHLVIGPPAAAAGGTLVLDPAGDHRMAFAFALLGLLRPQTYVAEPACVAKSWPAFWEDMAALGFALRELTA